MFGLFKKKKETPKPSAEETQKQEQAPEIKAFAEDFSGEETDILAVTGPGTFDRDPVGQSGLWKISIPLTAWMDEYTKQLQQGEARLEAVIDQKLLDYLLERVPRNFIITATVRPNADGTRFMMTDLPKPGFDPDLKAILDEQKKPVTLEVEGLGTFTLSRAMGWFQAAVDWMDAEVSMTLDQAEETLDSAQDTARVLVSDQKIWDERIRAFAAEQLLDRVNELAKETADEDDEAETFTATSLQAQWELDSILAGPDGAFEFLFSDDDLFLAHPVRVTGNLDAGPLQAEMD